MNYNCNSVPSEDKAICLAINESTYFYNEIYLYKLYAVSAVLQPYTRKLDINRFANPYIYKVCRLG